MRGLSLYTPPSPCSTSISWGSLDGRLAPHRIAAAVRQPAMLRAPRRLRVQAVSGPSTDGGVGQQAAARLQDAVNAARPHTSRFTKQLGVKLKDAAVNLNEAVRRTASKTDSRLHISQRTAQLAADLRIKAKSADQQLGASRRLRNAAEDFQRNWPKWSRQLRAFQSTILGQVLTCVVLFYAFSSGIAWRVLHFFWIVSWLAPLLLLPVLSRLNRRAAAGQAAAQAAAARRQQQQQQRQAGPRPFAGWSPFGTSAKPAGGYAAQQPGPVIDAEWETIDEGDH